MADKIPKGWRIKGDELVPIKKKDKVPKGWKIKGDELVPDRPAPEKAASGDSALDYLNIFDVFGAPVRSAIHEAQTGPATGLGNVLEAAQGVGKHIQRNIDEGPIDAIKMAPTGADITGGPVSGFAMEMATDPLSWTGIGGALKAVGARTAGKAVQKGAATTGLSLIHI